MDDNSILPKRVIQLGKALEPVQYKIAETLNKQFYPHQRTIQTLDPAGTIHVELNEIMDVIPRLVTWIDELMADVVTNEHASSYHINRHMSQGDLLLNRLTGSYNRLHHLDLQGKDKEAMDMLARLFRHILQQIYDWLSDFTETANDPLAAVRKRRLPTRGVVKIRFILKLTVPRKELRYIKKYLKAKAREEADQRYIEQKKTTPDERYGFWNKAGLYVLGFLFLNSLFGKSDDD